ncbi:MAG: hypothetical protein KZQ83_00520 [gamma proteobacterium symbiont of Taylorina sp.]|nr:hypothetical protein [gamma proteobacterium symbiont of Taylorina sp.]
MSYPDSFWDLIKMDYEIGDYSFGELAEKYEVSKASIHSRFTKEKWDKPYYQKLIQDSMDLVHRRVAYGNDFKQASPYTKKLMIKSLDEKNLLHEMAEYLFVDVKEIKRQRKLNNIMSDYGYN